VIAFKKQKLENAALKFEREQKHEFVINLCLTYNIEEFKDVN